MDDAPIDQIAVFIFYSISGGVQSSLSFSKEFKHCSSVTFDGRDWIALEFDRTGFMMRRVKCRDGAKFINRLSMNPDISATIAVQVNGKVSIAWKLYLVRSCNEIARYAAGVDIGLTFNPVHLYKKLLKYDRKRNYEIISSWRRSDGILTTPQAGTRQPAVE